MIRYLLDEHIASAYRTQLVRCEPSLEVWMLGDPDAPALGTLDPDILLWCEEHDFLLVTNNRKSMPVHLADHLAAGRHVPGIFLLNLSRGIAENVEELALIAVASQEGEYRDLLLYLPISGASHP